MKIELLAERKPRAFVAVQVTEIRKVLNHVMGTWSRRAVEAHALQGRTTPPEDDRRAWMVLHAHASQVEEMARGIRELAELKVGGPGNV